MGKRLGAAGLVGCLLLGSVMVGSVAAQVAARTRLGVANEEMKVIAVGWSTKKQVLGQPVYNEQNQRVGKIEDLIIALPEFEYAKAARSQCVA